MGAGLGDGSDDAVHGGFPFVVLVTSLKVWLKP
jgi:hypothetical protein